MQIENVHMKKFVGFCCFLLWTQNVKMWALIIIVSLIMPVLTGLNGKLMLTAGRKQSLMLRMLSFDQVIIAVICFV